MNLLFDHLWQSTAMLAVIGLLTLFFRSNGAAVRHALWTVASLKFLVPFAALNWLGSLLSGLFAQPLPLPVVQAVYGAAQPFSDGPVFDILPAPASPNWLPFLAIWGLGAIALLGVWTVRRIALGQAVRAARDTDIAAPMRVKLSATLMEPGLVGIVRPVLLLPEGVADKLTAHELAAIISHEACHMRRRDNLLATMHMLVQAIFWFWPPVWWLGTRLIAERERACDEAVVAEGNDPHIYAESILKVCKHYVSSPLACASGVSGADLKKRMEEIMKNSVIARLNIPKKLLLTASAIAVLALPVALGILPVPAALAQATAAPVLEPILRRHITGLMRKQPAFDDMAPALVEATNRQQAGIFKTLDGMGALRTLTFREKEGPNEVYLAVFDNGVQAWTIGPLQDGKISTIFFGPAIIRQDNGPSPGLEPVIRRFVAANLAGTPDAAIMSPNLAEAVTRQMQAMSANNKRLGPLRSLTFQRVNNRGWDVYRATYENGTTTIQAEPLKDGRLDGILQGEMQFPNAKPHPGTEASLRRYIESMQRGLPNYDEMGPQLANAVREQLASTQATIQSLGALKSITFKAGGPADSDIYDVVFEKGQIEWITGPLTADGKVERRGYRIIN